ncbi:MAG: hypothetical protein ACO1SV_08125 [Fimbriimonas sp.]
MRKTLFPCFVILAAAGCGGSGLLGTNAAATLDATPNPAPYGVPIRISWGGHLVKEVLSSNFGVPRDVTSGTIEDNPGVDTTYQIKVQAQNSGREPIEISKTLTVQIAKSSKSVVVVGDASAAGPNQVADSLKTLTAGAVTVAPSLAAAPAGADLIVFHPTASIEGADSVAAMLDSGKGVIFIGESIVNLSDGDVSSSGGILGGATGVGGDYDAKFRSESGFVPFAARYRGAKLAAAFLTPFGGLEGVGGSADRLIVAGSVTCAMAYRVPTGGKTGFVQEDGVGSTSNAFAFNLALRVIARWCMDGS